jgi:iron complex outermembrane receptor protein
MWCDKLTTIFIAAGDVAMIQTIATRVLGAGVLALLCLGAAPDGEAGPRRRQGPRPPDASARLAQASQSAMAFDIPEQALADALTAFSAQTRIQVLYAGTLAAGVRSPGVSGTYTPEQAVQRLLTGTGLTYRVTGTNAVALGQAAAGPPDDRGRLMAALAAVGGGQPDSGERPLTIPEVTVTAEQERGEYRVRTGSTATRSAVPLLETPVSIQVVPRQVLEDQSALRLNDVLRNVSGVTPAYTGNNVAATEGPIIRGFNVFNTYWNGFRLRGQAPSILANVEQVEVLKGPGSVLYGQQEPGGLVNLITKQPLASPYYSLEQRAGSYNYYETLLDAGGPLSGDGSVLYRLNVSYLNAGSFRDFVDSERWFVAPALTWKITSKTALTVEASYSHNDFLWDNGLVFSPAAFNPPFSPVLPIERFLQEPAFRSAREEWFASYRLQHQINENWNVRHLFLYHRNEFDINAYRIGAVSAPGGILTVNRRFDGTVPTATELNAIVDTTYRFELAGMKHALLAGVDFGYEPKDGNSQDGPRGLPLAQPIDAFNPVYGAVPTGFTQTSFFVERFLFGVYAQNQVSLLEDRLHVLLGGRFDYVDQDTLFINPPTPPSGGSRTDSAFTFRGGVLYEATAWLHPFFSYSQGFVPTTGFTVGQVDPETSQQFEFGLKMPFFGERLVATVALYELTKDNVIGDSNNDGVSENFGELRSRGVEVDVVGRIYEGLSTIATYAYTDTKVLESDFLPVGGRFIAVPYHIGSLWLKYDFAPESPVRGLSVGTGVYLVGSRPGNNANQFEVDGYVRWDAFLRYRMPLPGIRALTAQVNVQNLLDKEYYEAVNNTVAVPGAPLSVIGSIKVEF